MTEGVAHIFLETHNWGKTVAFWTALGFELEFETDHNSGRLRGPDGSSVFVAERSPLDPVGMEVFLAVSEGGGPAPEGVDVAFDWTETHWKTQLMTVRDPDGRLIRLVAPVGG